MRMWKRLARREAVVRTAGLLIARYAAFVHATNRWTVEGEDSVRDLLAARQAFIVAFWHGRLLMPPFVWQRRAPMHMVSSPHPDGRIIATAVNSLGISTIYGSSSHGGTVALREIVRTLRRGECVGITPDGPRGPAMQVGGAVAALARLAKVPIVPLAYATSNRRILDTWDRFHLALPFGRGAYIWGEPILPEGHSEESLGRLLEGRLNDITEAADRRVGRDSPVANAGRRQEAVTANGRRRRG